jgi:hypothetical protein
MGASILRWKAGSGGDMVLYLKSLCDPGSVVNSDYLGVDEKGATRVNDDIYNFQQLEDLKKIALGQWFINDASATKLLGEIQTYLHDDSVQVWLKSHYYQSDFLLEHTIDLIVDEISLPFVVHSFIDKVYPILASKDLNKLSSLIPTEIEKTKYTAYTYGRTCFYKNLSSLSKKQVVVSKLLVDFDTLITVFDEFQLNLDRRCHEAYQHWLFQNKHRLPSDRYLAKISNGDLDYMDSNLTIFERYSLLILSGHKFIMLE